MATEFVWIDSTAYQASGEWVMPADLWADCAGYRIAAILIYLEKISGSATSIAPLLRTAPCETVLDEAWISVGTVENPSGTTYLIYHNSYNDAKPLMSQLRLGVSLTGGSAEFNIRAVMLLK